VTRGPSPRLPCPMCGRHVTRSREHADGTWKVRAHHTPDGKAPCASAARVYDAETGRPRDPAARPIMPATGETIDAVTAARAIGALLDTWTAGAVAAAPLDAAAWRLVDDVRAVLAGDWDRSTRALPAVSGAP